MLNKIDVTLAIDNSSDNKIKSATMKQQHNPTAAINTAANKREKQQKLNVAAWLLLMQLLLAIVTLTVSISVTVTVDVTVAAVSLQQQQLLLWSLTRTFVVSVVVIVCKMLVV